jgi:hypothetical protein
LEDLFVAAPGQCQVVFEMCAADGSVAILPAQQRVAFTAELAEAVRQICGGQSAAAVTP